MSQTISIQSDLDFSRATRLTTGAETSSTTPLNSVYLFDDVYVDPVTGQKVDSLVTFYDSYHSYLGRVDSSVPSQYNKPNLNPKYLDPWGNFYGENYTYYIGNPVDANIKLNIQFIADQSVTANSLDNSKVSVVDSTLLYNGTTFYDNVTLSNMAWETYNLGGYTMSYSGGSFVTGSQFYVQANNSDPDKVKLYPTSSDSKLVVSNPSTNTVRVQSGQYGSVNTVPGTVEFEQHRATVSMLDTSKIDMIIGDASVRATTTNQFYINFTVAPTPPLPPPTPKFFVVDDTYDQTSFYGLTGDYIGNWYLNTAVTPNPTDIAATATGSKFWVIDSSRKIGIYDSVGSLTGSWTANTSDKTPEGIAYDNFNTTNSLWTADRSGKISWFSGAGVFSSGSYSPNKTFSLSLGSKNYLKGIATDYENNLWVVIDGDDQIRRYKINRSGNTPTGVTLTGTWKLATGSATPTGITLDPSQSSSNGDIWIVVDGTTDKMIKYSGLRGQAANSTLPTGVETILMNTVSPQGIVDPLIYGESTPITQTYVPAVTEAPVAPTAPSLSTFQAFGFLSFAAANFARGDALGVYAGVTTLNTLNSLISSSAN